MIGRDVMPEPLVEKPAVGADGAKKARHEGDLRVFRETLEGCPDGVRQQAIVGVKEDEERAVRDPDAKVAGLGTPRVSLTDAADARIARRNLAGVVGRPIIDDHDFDM